MEVNSICKGVLLGFLLSLLFMGTFCQASDNIVEVVGEGECADCKEKNILMNQAFAGLHVTIDCKVKDGHFKQKGVANLDKEGKFKVTLFNNGDDNEVCYAQLHSASSAPCPAHNGLEATKIVAKSGPDGKNTFEPAEKLKFSTDLCTSATWGPYFKHPPLPNIHSWKKHFGHHYFKSPPIDKKPEPKKSKPEAPEKPLPPPQPKKKKPEAPEKPLPPSEPKKKKPEAPKKPSPPSAPKKSKFPSEKPPVKEKPCPSVPEIPNTPKTPKIAKSPKIPADIPKSPPKFFFHHHHKFPYFPPLPPHAPHA